MIKVESVIVVEGKYDKIRLENIIDGTIISTDGFGIFKNKELLNLLRRLADTKGLIILTDSDSAGFMIRSFLCGAIDNSKVKHVYIPEILGKEKRKAKSSAEGLLGVEGINDEVIKAAFEKAGIINSKPQDNCRKIEKLDLYELGFVGKSDSEAKRKALLKALELPSKLSSNRLLEVLNILYSYEEFIKIANEVK